MNLWVFVANPVPPDDHHTWARPAGDDCPDCGCCTDILCRTARERGVPCASVGSGGMDLTGCLCALRAELARTLGRVAELDPSNPANAGRWPGEEAERQYQARNACLVSAVRQADRLGMRAWTGPDPAEPDWAVVGVSLPGVGQVRWHVPLPLAPGLVGLPDGPEWDGHDTTQKYRRVAAWIAADDAR